MWQKFLYILWGLKYTIFYSIICFLGGFVLGLIGAFSIFCNNYSKNFFLIYKYFITSTPLITQIFIGYFFIPLNVHYVCIIILTINSSAYFMNILLTTLKNINSIEWESSIIIGLTPIEALKKVFFEEIIIMSSVNISEEFINLIKESSIFSVFGVAEIYFRTKSISYETYDFVSYMIFLTIIYMLIIYIWQKVFSLFIKHFTRRPSYYIT